MPSARRTGRVLLSSLAVLLVPLVVVALVGVPSMSRRLFRSSEAAREDMARVGSTLVSTALDGLEREARLLARDPAILQGVVKRDWATLARGASPRMLSLTLDRVADLILIVDERGAPLVQVPAGASLPGGSLDQPSGVHLVSGIPMLVGAAPVVQDGRTLGTVVVGRTFDTLAKGVGTQAGRLELLFLSGSETAYTTLADRAGGVRWADATRAGRVEMRDASYFVHLVGRWPAGTLWLLVSDAEVRGTTGVLWRWVIAFALLAASGTVAAAWILIRREPQPVQTPGVAGRKETANNAGLFVENQRKVEELSVLYELSRAVTGELDLSELVRAIHAQVGRVLDARNMVILLYDKARQEIEVARRMSQGEEQPVPRRYPFGEGLVSRIIERGQPIRTDNYAEACRREGVKPVLDSLRYPYWLGVPMIAGNETIGSLLLRSDVHVFSASDERLLMNIAGLAALAFRSARLFDERAHAYEDLAAAQDQLVRTEKLRALGEMASGVAHDFNNLLASILGRTQLLLRQVDDPRLRQWLQVIERAAADGARMVRRIQEFARIRRDRPCVAVDLNRVVQEALEATQSRRLEEAQSRGITIDVTTDLAPTPPVGGDPTELRDVLTNLILNAVDAMPDGGTLALSTSADDTMVTVSVSDTGVGMSEDVQRQLFHTFFTTKGPKGTGLGLSMAYSVVSRHGGQIAVESAEGRGSTFRLTFPVGRVQPEPERPEPLPVASPPLRCLVVDDEQPVLDVLGDILAVGGHSAVLVADGAAAIERFKAEPFDLVLTDLGMPRVTGWQVARAVKDHASSVPVLLITGWGVELSAEELRAHGVDAVLVKPVRLEDVLAAVARQGVHRPR